MKGVAGQDAVCTVPAPDSPVARMYEVAPGGSPVPLPYDNAVGRAEVFSGGDLKTSVTDKWDAPPSNWKGNNEKTGMKSFFHH